MNEGKARLQTLQGEKTLRAQFKVPQWHSDVRTPVNHVESTLGYQRRTLIMTANL